MLCSMTSHHLRDASRRATLLLYCRRFVACWMSSKKRARSSIDSSNITEPPAESVAKKRKGTKPTTAKPNWPEYFQDVFLQFHLRKIYLIIASNSYLSFSRWHKTSLFFCLTLTFGNVDLQSLEYRFSILFVPTTHSHDFPDDSCLCWKNT